MNRRGIRVTSVLVMAGLLIFAIYYPYKFFFQMIPLDFSGPTGWQEIYMVDDDVLVPLAARTAHFIKWIPSVLFTELMVVMALYLVHLIYRGVYFCDRTARALQWVGGLGALAALATLLSISFEAWMLTRFNAEHVAPIKFQFDSGEMGVLLAGLGVFMLGWVFRVAMFKDKENREII